MKVVTSVPTENVQRDPKHILYKFRKPAPSHMELTKQKRLGERMCGEGLGLVSVSWADWELALGVGQRWGWKEGCSPLSREPD